MIVFKKFVFALFLALSSAEVNLHNIPANDCRSINEIEPVILDGLTQEKFIDILTNPCHYDRFSRPETVEPLRVYLQIKLDHIEAADKISFNAYLIMQYRFQDYRLRYGNRSPRRHRVLGREMLKNKIWIPHVIIKNEKMTSVMGVEGKDVFLSISPEGEVIYSYRMTVNFYCTMYLAKFPFDSQECELTWATWTYNTSKLMLFWDEDFAVIASDTLHLTEFMIQSITTHNYTVNGTFDRGNLVGNFTELSIKFKLYREIGYYMMDYFLPSVLLVCTAWVTFWLQADAGPPRATLGASTVVAFITLNLGLASGIPKVSYIKASDIWFLACSCFIFGSLAEFAFVNVIWRRRKVAELKKPTTKHFLKAAITPSAARRDLRKKVLKQAQCYENSIEKSAPELLSVNGLSAGSLNSDDVLVSMDGGTVSISVPDSSEALTWHTMSPQEIAIWIDRKARIVFPVAFAIFNLFYWTFVFLL